MLDYTSFGGEADEHTSNGLHEPEGQEHVEIKQAHIECTSAQLVTTEHTHASTLIPCGRKSCKSHTLAYRAPACTHKRNGVVDVHAALYLQIKEGEKAQYMDKLKVERDRGITVSKIPALRNPN